jgi:hypothetical protein
MPTFTEAQMRADLEGEIKLAAPLAVVFPWWALGGDERTWPGKLVSPADNNLVHGYVITPNRTYSVRENPNCLRQFFTYEIRGLRWYDDAGTRAANSDLAYTAELTAICQRFANKPNLPRSIMRIAEGGELDFRINLNLYGGQLLHRSIGQITIEQC